ncbi:MAG: FAD-dependent monooxygenase [Myxococcales bacterium]|nr:FAD-dependent monooxygenase [Myxococcales bacterium]
MSETLDRGAASAPIQTHEIIIAGAGPTGLALAAELALARVDVAIVEPRAAQVVEGLRAGGLHARTIEILDQRGVAERFIAKGKRAQIAGFARVALDISDLPTRHNYGLVLGQEAFEQEMLAWVRELGVVVYRAVAVQDFVDRGDEVEVALSDGRRCAARYLVGCDGGRSFVRKRAGVDFVGTDPQTSFALAEVEFGREPRWGLGYGPFGVRAIGPMGEPRRARVVLTERYEGQPRALSLDELRALLIDAYGEDFGLVRASWLSRFTDATRQATTYRRGRVLLAGDAAHAHSPVGGKGLDTGVQDAVNLGWKLAAVVRGEVDSALLDSYEAERHPAAADVLRSTLAQVALDRDDPRCAAMREAMVELLRMDEPRRRYGAKMSGLDVRYELGGRHPLVGRRVPDLDLRANDQVFRVYTWLRDARGVLLELADAPTLNIAPWTGRIHHVRARYDGAWALPGVGSVEAPSAVLVRPDGHVAWVDDGAGEGLTDALVRWFGAAR